MKRFFIKQILQVNSVINIDGVEHNHIKNVMRLNVFDKIILVCGDAFDYEAEIISITRNYTSVKILSKNENIYNPKVYLDVYQAFIKSDCMSIVVQKLTELGVSNFYPFDSEFVITSKNNFTKSSKLQEISNQSIKQCRRSIPMKIGDNLSFMQMLDKIKTYDVVLFANEKEKNNILDLKNLDKNKKVAIIVGSEGGFSEDEINKIIELNGKSITMGKRILRAETASIALTSVVMCLMGEWSYE